MSTRLFAVTFALGSGLAGLGGALAIAMVGLDPSFALTYLIYVLIVVSVGGLGSIAGSFAAAMLLGVSDVAGKYYVPATRLLPDLSGDDRAADVAADRPVREALGVTSETIARPISAVDHSARPVPLALERDRVLAGDAAAVRADAELSGAWRARSRSPRCSRCRSISSSAFPASSRSATPPISASAPIRRDCCRNGAGASRSPAS